MVHYGESPGAGAEAVHVSCADGTAIAVPDGERLRFGRGHGVDLVVAGGQVLSRRAGEITALAGGAWIANISRSHALYVEGEDYHVRLPPAGTEGPTGGWLVVSGTVAVGSMAMLRQGMALRLTVSGAGRPPESSRHSADVFRRGRPGGVLSPASGATSGHSGADEITTRPLQFRPDTKLFLVALLLCQPWLLNPSHSPALPTAPEIARAALELTEANYQLRRLESDPAFRNRLVEHINEHLKYLRERIQASGLTQPGTRLTPIVMADVLLSNDVLTRADLAVLDSPEWRSRQENLWWRTGS